MSEAKLRVPSANVRAFAVIAMHPFRRLGTQFPRGKEIIVAAAGLSPEKQLFLLNSDPRDLVVREILDEPAPAQALPSPARVTVSVPPPAPKESRK